MYYNYNITTKDNVCFSTSIRNLVLFYKMLDAGRLEYSQKRCHSLKKAQRC